MINLQHVLICVVLITTALSIGQSQSVDDHECLRECKWPPEPMTCRYVFTMEWIESMSGDCFDCPFNQTDCERPGCIAANGVERPVISVNRQLPGPPIQVCEGDDVEVKVWNRLSNADVLAMHWHALRQHGTQYMDGTTMITQCPISPQSSFTYNFKAFPSGTHWYHSHSNVQRADGAFGALIIHEAPDRDPNSDLHDLYDYDLTEHIVFVQAWPNAPASPIGAVSAASLLINTKGQYEAFESGNQTVYTPRDTFKVTQGYRYRFRVIGNTACHLDLSVDNHTLTVIAADAASIIPIEVDRIGINSGERYDFVLNADQEVDNYWMRLRVAGGRICRNSLQEELAILRYDGAQLEDPPVRPDDESDGVIVNPYVLETPNAIKLTDIESAVPDDERLLGEPDKRFYLELGNSRVPRHRYDPSDYPNPVVSGATEFLWHINFVSFKFPTSPLLSQLDIVNEDEMCYVEDTGAEREKCKNEYCSCVHVLKVGLNELVELVVVNEGGNHPMHIHGYSFRIVGSAKLPADTIMEDVIVLDEQGNLTRNLENAVLKDTFFVSSGSYTIARFVADNPGSWLFHCHDLFHLIGIAFKGKNMIESTVMQKDGMSILLKVGEPSDLPPVPDGFPLCGSFGGTTSENDNDKERKGGEDSEDSGDSPPKERKQRPSA